MIHGSQRTKEKQSKKIQMNSQHIALNIENGVNSGIGNAIEATVSVTAFGRDDLQDCLHGIFRRISSLGKISCRCLDKDDQKTRIPRPE